MKICTKCEILKENTEFGKTNKNKDGLKSYCDPCRRQYSKQYYKKNKERLKIVNEKWRKENQDSINEYYREYYKVNWVDYSKRNKKYYEKRNKQNGNGSGE